MYKKQGFAMASLWFSFGLAMGFLRDSYGFPMGPLWFAKVFLWVSYDFPVVPHGFLRVSYGSYTFPMV